MWLMKIWQDNDEHLKGSCIKLIFYIMFVVLFCFFINTSEA